jgi:hypothetical protein
MMQNNQTLNLYLQAISKQIVSFSALIFYQYTQTDDVLDMHDISNLISYCCQELSDKQTLSGEYVNRNEHYLHVKQLYNRR